MRSFGAIVSNGCEADDLLGIEQMSYFRNGSEDSCIVSIDKDLNCIPGWHFNPGLIRKGIVVKEPSRYLVSPKEALHFFYTQLLVGDTADGIKGAIGIGPAKAKQILEGCETEWDYYQACLNFFSCEEELTLNAQCLWIFQKEGDIWQAPVEPRETPQLYSISAETRNEALPTKI